ncbi:MAG: hypothetical protein RIR10_650, partial [Planctomycetota bacterium]
MGDETTSGSDYEPWTDKNGTDKNGTDKNGTD